MHMAATAANLARLVGVGSRSQALVSWSEMGLAMPLESCWELELANTSAGESESTRGVAWVVGLVTVSARVLAAASVVARAAVWAGT